MKRLPAKLVVLVLLICGALSAMPGIAAEPTRNVILFVADGLRHGIVTPETGPTLSRVMQEGVTFSNSHSIFPTFTTANASVIATGHYLGDTGDFSNTIYTGKEPLPAAKGSITPFLEADPILGDIDQRFNGNYLNEESVLALARAAGYDTATIGKQGPALIMDHTDRGQNSIVIDDSTGQPAGVPLPSAVQEAMKAAGLSLVAPARGVNGDHGSFNVAGTMAANVNQQAYFVSAATTVVLPLFKRQNKPFLLVFWSRDPDGTQHNQGDSFLRLTPGINGPTSLAAVRNVDNNLATILSALKSLGLDATTDVIVTADHGFSTISKQSDSSPATKTNYSDVPAHMLPPGFLGIDLATALQLPLFDPDNGNAAVPAGAHPTPGNALIGVDASHPSVVVAANGGSDLIYLPGEDHAAIAPKVVDALLAQDYVSGVFVDDSLGRFPGTLPLSAVNLSGKAVTPIPAIVVNFKSFHVSSPACPTWLTCTAEIADSTLQQGQGMHGSFSRADTFNFTAAIGPSFKHAFVDRMPISNADVGRTIAKLLQLPIAENQKGPLMGRVLNEALLGGREAPFKQGQLVSTAATNGLKTVVHYQQVGETRYFSVAGFPGRTVGLDASGKPEHLDDAPNKKN
ncbi:alkaline phosphatase family protein [Dyella acidisoli]|uniref:Nucleotide pyrophosphatase n=1 Tax=Dyella acidisoli TaxID=1867834 RepID=A0ABQ5XJX9_9GAMM|nr:alkaline phosphatase family protein [Dyella acidisoli]GLQ91277.1 nucleotide pyrophosphatase [Dyella acidisoli]